MKRLFFLHTGGTLGMTAAGGGELEPGHYAENVLPFLKGLDRKVAIDGAVLCNLDSSDLTPAHWEQLASAIAERHESVDGFVVVHGTDTMAYTATALALLLENLQRPVVLTGAQRPIAELRSDARMNLMHAAISATLSVPEVGIWFGSTLLRGCRATKLSVDSYQAFSSPNLPPLVEMGVDIHYATPALERPGPFRLRRGFRRDVVVLSLHPGMPPRMLDFALEAGARGVVLQGFGAGNLPLDGWAEAISRAADAGVPVVVGSQCRFGRVTLGSYAGSAAARDAGALSAYDMTQEATLVKLMFLLGQGLDRADLAEAWPIALAGELTP